VSGFNIPSDTDAGTNKGITDPVIILREKVEIENSWTNLRYLRCSFGGGINLHQVVDSTFDGWMCGGKPDGRKHQKNEESAADQI